MVQADRSHVLKRLRELRDWADYIRVSVTEDQKYESGKASLLLSILGEEAVAAIRDGARRLSELLEKGAVLAEEGPATSQAA